MQALTGLFARQFGTPNYAAHGGFCSVNMAAGMIYTIGGSFWEFGGPDLERAKLFVMIGTAEDHHSNPLKIAISKFKRDGGRFISINPIRTGYSAIADEWVPIRPGTDGALLLALIHELIELGLYDRDFLVALHERGPARESSIARRRRRRPARPRRRRLPPNPDRAPEHDRDPMWWDRITDRPVPSHTEGADPYLYGEFTLPGRAPGQAGAPAAEGARRRLHAGVGGGDHRHSGRDDPPSRARDGRHRARPARSSCRSRGPTRGAASTRPSPAIPSRFTRCAGSPRIRTASRRSARSRS